MPESYYLTVCSLGENPNLSECLQRLLSIKHAREEEIEVLLVLNSDKVLGPFAPDVLVYYEHELGYSNVRNKAISVTPESSNVVFLDDDEIPSVEWFEALREAHETFPDDLIFGPVYPLHESEANSYRKQASQKYKTLSDGDTAKQAPTANLLIPSTLLKRGLIHFDPVFNKSGSEDTDLCFRLRKLGIKIRFAERAILFENEKPQRFNVDYLQARRKKDIANYSLVIRRSAGPTKVLWRLNTLLLRVLLLSVLGFTRSEFQRERDVYLCSLQVLLSGKPVES